MTNQTSSPNRVCFLVSDVKPATERLPVITVRTALERAVKTPLQVCPKAEDHVVEAGDFHPLIAAATLAYKQHYPLVLSPDVIWITILQGVAQHIANRPEALRSRLVAHQTKIELLVDTRLSGPPTSDAEMLAVVNAFTKDIGRHVPPDKRFLLNTEFSTTTDVERIVGAIVVMDAFQPYFDYVFSCICGIPSVTLEGTTEDWELLAAKIRLLHDADLDLSWWTQHLLPLADQFARASRGDVDKTHWQNLCKLVERYGVDDLNGWLLKFIPYVRQGRNEAPKHWNPVLEQTEFLLDTDKMGKITGCTSNMLPTGVSRVPVVCQNKASGEATNLQFLAGLVGVSQSAADLSIRPVIGWAIARVSLIDELIDKLRTQYGCTAPAEAVSMEMIEPLGLAGLPGDMLKFYTEISSVRIKYRVPKQNGLDDETRCQIFGIQTLKPLWDINSILDELDALHDQGEISVTFLAERKKFISSHGGLREIALVRHGSRSTHYVYGQVVDRDTPDFGPKIYQWNGKRHPGFFIPVATSFTEWLASILNSIPPASP